MPIPSNLLPPEFSKIIECKRVKIRVIDLIQALADGDTLVGYVREMGGNIQTVKNYMFHSLYEKVGACSAAHLVAICLRRGYIE